MQKRKKLNSKNQLNVEESGFDLAVVKPSIPNVIAKYIGIIIKLKKMRKGEWLFFGLRFTA